MKIDIKSIIDIVKKVAIEELLPRFTTVISQHKADGSIVTEADLVMHNRLEAELLNVLPGSVLLSEEMTKEQQQMALESAQLVWCLDPLDGTSNYASGIPYFAVSLTLIEQWNVIMGIVYDPVRNECFSADRHSVAKINGKKITLFESKQGLSDAIAIIDLKRLDKKLSIRIASQQPFASQRNFGASALDWCWLMMNRGQIYLHGKQNIWDYSAGHYIFEKAGGISQTLNGDKVFCNKLEGRSVVAAVDKDLFDDWFNWINKQ